MKKVYSAPDIEFESFSLSVSIASCAVEANFSQDMECGYEFTKGMVLFVKDIDGCSMVIEDGSGNKDGWCYHNYSDDKRLFNS